MNTHRHPASTLVSLLSALCLLAGCGGPDPAKQITNPEEIRRLDEATRMK